MAYSSIIDYLLLSTIKRGRDHHRLHEVAGYVFVSTYLTDLLDVTRYPYIVAVSDDPTISSHKIPHYIHVNLLRLYGVLMQ